MRSREIQSAWKKYKIKKSLMTLSPKSIMNFRSLINNYRLKKKIERKKSSARIISLHFIKIELKRKVKTGIYLIRNSIIKFKNKISIK